MSDEELIRRMAKRDAGAFGIFYDRHADRMMGLLRNLVATPRDAEDVLQESFCQVWLQAARYDSSRGRPAAWLLVIARSRALDLLRKRPRRVANESDVDLPALQSTDPAPEEQESTRLAERALAQLPLEQRTVLMLSFFHGYTHEQIAEQASLPLGTVKSRIRLGIRRLRAILEQDQSAA